MTLLTYVAKYGDYLVGIADRHGTTWQEIWNHPLNAEHRQKRFSRHSLSRRRAACARRRVTRSARTSSPSACAAPSVFGCATSVALSSSSASPWASVGADLGLSRGDLQLRWWARQG